MHGAGDAVASLGSTLLFAGRSSAIGVEPWRSDGTPAGTSLLKDVELPDASSAVTAVTSLGDNRNVVFAADDGATGLELWRSDGTPAGTALVKDIRPGPQSSIFTDWTATAVFAELDGVTYFAADDGTAGFELWRTDGTPAGTFLAVDVMPGPHGSGPRALTRAGSRIFFAAMTNDVGLELWRSDGSVAGTSMMGDLRPGSASSFPVPLTAVGDVLYFTAFNEPTGRELYRCGGGSGGAVLVKDLVPGPGSGEILFPVAFRDRLFFSLDGDLWQSDGTAAGTHRVLDLAPGLYDAVGHLTVVKDRLFFAGYHPTAGRELWKTDGTAAGTVLVKDLVPGITSSFPDQPCACGDLLLFAASDPATGFELWRSDGTAGGTWMVKDIGPGSEGGVVRSGFIHAPSGAARALLLASDGQNGAELWVTDGTAAGTVLHTDLASCAQGSSPSVPVLAGSRLFFVADDGIRGRELHAMPSMAAAEPFGRGCAGQGGIVPALSTVDVPAIGNPRFALRVDRGRPNSVAILLYGATPAYVPVGGGCLLHVLDFLYVTAAPTDGLGTALFPLPMPHDPAYRSAQFCGQALVVDPAGSFQGLLSFTQGSHVVCFDR
jgi:ELWxxDGT repeat protein